jgi:steroid delta-isomerase-like uncharacterized protein
MSTKENRDLIRKIYSAMKDIAGDAGKIRSLYEENCTPDFIIHDLARGDMNREQRIQIMISLLPALPDLTFSIDDMVAEGDKVVARYTMKATHKGTMMGIPASGKQFAVKGIDINRIVRGKVAEVWSLSDSLGVMTQLGAIPSAASKK